MGAVLGHRAGLPTEPDRTDHTTNGLSAADRRAACPGEGQHFQESGRVGNPVVIDLNGLSSGPYLIEVHANKGLLVKKVVKVE